MERKLEVGSWKRVGGRRLVLGAALVFVGVLVVGTARGDLERLWMVWGDARADSGRVGMQTDATGYWSAARVLEGRVALRKTATAFSSESIPKPVEPGSRVGSVEVPAEGVDQIVSPKAVWK